MSLGADPRRVQAMILREGGLLVGLGLLTGVVGSLLLARSIEGLLYGVAPREPDRSVGVAQGVVKD